MIKFRLQLVKKWPKFDRHPFWKQRRQMQLLMKATKIWSHSLDMANVATPLLEECEDDTHTPKMGTWESSRTLETSELDCRGQNTSHWGVLYIIGKLWKCRCWKWDRMGHSDICSTSLLQTWSQSEVWTKSYDLVKSWESKPGQFWDSTFGVPGQKGHSDVGAAEQRKEYYMGEGGGFPQVRAMVNQVSSCCMWLVPTLRVALKVY
jgi:hypothetical protein